MTGTTKLDQRQIDRIERLLPSRGLDPNTGRIIELALRRFRYDRLGLEAPLTELGSSVMLMLQATRDPDWLDLPMEAVVDVVRNSGRGAPDEARRRALSAFEREVAGRPHVFAREQIHRSHLITLTGVAVGARLPTRRITWSQSFTDESARDDFFGWLAERTDRWDDWGQLAYSKGAKRLTEHFLTLVIGAGVTPS